MNFSPHDDTPHKFRTDVVLADMDTGAVVSGNMRIIYLMLPLFGKNSEEECETDFDCWIYVLKNMEILNRMPFTARDAVFKKLAEIASVEHLHHEEREKYEESLKVLRDEYNIRMTAIEEGMAKGMAEGMKANTLATIKRMCAIGMDIDMMTKVTGWSVDEINKTIKDLE